jgi:sugar/nucleoside kinase (ribokinase family)
MKSQVLCYGGICIDNIIHVPYMPTPGIATTPSHQQFQLGGGATQTAIWLANWQIPVALSGNVIGTDPYAQQILKEVSEYTTFDTTQIHQKTHVETPYTRAIIPPSGDRYLIEIGYNTAPMIPAKDINLDNIEILTVNFYYNNAERETQRLAKRAKTEGVMVIASDVLDEDNGLFAVSDVLINSRAVMEKKLPSENHYDYSIMLQEKHGGIVIMTDGENRVWIVNGDGQTFSVDVPQVKIYDTTGAGDAFRAGLIYGILQDWELEASVKLGVASGTLQVKRNASTTPPASFEETLSLAKTLNVARS